MASDLHNWSLVVDILDWCARRHAVHLSEVTLTNNDLVVWVKSRVDVAELRPHINHHSLPRLLDKFIQSSRLKILLFVWLIVLAQTALKHLIARHETR